MLRSSPPPLWPASHSQMSCYLPANLPLTMIKGGYLTALDDVMNVQEETKLSDQIIEAGSYGTGKTYGFLHCPATLR